MSGYEGLYKVSNLGRIKNSKNKIIKQHKDHKGYLVLQLHKNNKPKTVRAHRIVAIAFIDNLENKPQINHINCNKTDNRISNLEWVTDKENQEHAKINGLKNNSKERKEHSRARKIIQYSLDGKFIKKWDCATDAMEYLNKNTLSNIIACCRKKKKKRFGKEYYCKTAYGYIWRYAEERLENE